MIRLESWTWPPRFDEEFMPPVDQPFWFPNRETMPPADRDAAILERIQAVMRYAYDGAPFYRRKWDDAGVHPDHISSLEDFERVPHVTKEELRISQAAHEPFGDYLGVEPDDVQHVHGTSGTTGRPTIFGISRMDWRAIANAHARVMWGMGIRPTDTVFIGAFLSLYMGSWGALIGAERLGARVIPFGAGAPGQTARAAGLLVQLRPTVFYGTPSYALHLAEVAAEAGINPRDFGLRIMFFSGEPGASVPAIRGRIEEVYEALVFDSGSMAEMSPWMNLGESSARAGMLCWQDIVYTEVVDPKSFARVPYGGEGTPVYTHLERTSQPMIRLLSGDLTRWESGPSPCGRTYPILPDGIYGRIDDMLVIRGENVYPSAIHETLLTLPGYGGEHRILVTHERAMDELHVEVEWNGDVSVRGPDEIVRWQSDAERALLTALGVRAQVAVLSRGSLPRTQLKAQRVIDMRESLSRPDPTRT